MTTDALESLISHIFKKDTWMNEWQRLLILILIIFSKDIVRFAKQFGKYIVNGEFEMFKTAFRAVFMKQVEGRDWDDIIGFDLELQKIREHYNAKSVSYTAYHNGVDEGYKNYSTRYECARTQKDITRHLFQSQPLAPFMGLIREWEKYPVLIIDKDNTELEYIQAAINAGAIGINKFAIVPVMIPEKEIYPSTKKHLVLNVQWGKTGKYVLIGCINIIFDEQSINTNIAQSPYVIFIGAIAYSCYLKNPKIFAK